MAIKLFYLQQNHLTHAILQSQLQLMSFRGARQVILMAIKKTITEIRAKSISREFVFAKSSSSNSSDDQPSVDNIYLWPY